jgi:hypothetical protein
MVFSLELQLKKLDRIERDKIIAAKSGRARKLMALQRGLVKRGDREGSRLVIEALKTPVAVPPPPVSLTKGKEEEERKAIALKKISLLTYNRAKKRWQEFDGGGVVSSVSAGATTLHYVEGDHWLLKVLWPNVLEAGSRFSVEVKGVFSVGVIDLEGHDANAHFSFPKTDGFVKVEIERAKDSVAFTCDGQRKTTKYMSGKLRGDAARAAMISRDLRVTISTKKGEKASFRNAKLMKP